MKAPARAILKRVATLIVSLLVASLVVFLLINLLPGDVTGVILGANADPGSVAQLRAAMGLDQPLILRYFSWLGGMLRLDPGTSIFTGQAISQQLPHRLEATFSLVFAGMILALVLAIPLGMLGALRRNRKSGIVVSVLSQLGMAIPAFLAGMLLTIVFAVKLQVLPANGYVSFQDDPLEWARYLFLPALSIAIVQGAVLTRYTRSAFIEVIKQDYFRTARAIGWRFSGGASASRGEKRIFTGNHGLGAATFHPAGRGDCRRASICNPRFGHLPDRRGWAARFNRSASGSDDSGRCGIGN